MGNINTKEYWETRFNNGSWNKSGQKQTREYALANVKNMGLSSDFDGTILDFGCALGDAIPIYKQAFPKSKISGTDLSEQAIIQCKKRFGEIADFFSGDNNNLFYDLIIASHVMEHLSNDKEIVRDLLKKCKNLYVFVPFMEDPLFREHINCYNDDYYHDFDILTKKVFTVKYKTPFSFRQIISKFLHGEIALCHNFSKEIIMFHFKGQF